MTRLNLSEWAIRHSRLVVFLMVLLSGAGATAYLILGRAEDPSFTFRSMVITAAWPGATARDVELQVIDRIEAVLQGLPYFDYVRSYAQPGSATMTLTLKDYTPPSEVAEIWYQVRKRIGDIRGTLPDGVRGPFFNDEFGDVFGSIYALSGDGFSMAELEDVAEQVRQRLLQIPDVNKVEILGAQPQRIFVEISHARLATLGVSIQQIFESLRRQNVVVPAGRFETPSDRVFLRVTGQLDTLDAVRAVPVQAGGRLLWLGDIAEISRGYEDPPAFTMRHNGRQVVGLAISMARGGNVLRMGEALDAEIARLRQTSLPHGIEIDQVYNQPVIVAASVGEFVGSFVEALAIVLAVSFLSLGWRSGIVVGLAVPLVLAGTLAVMQAIGMNLDRISLGALIIALGLLVDDAIIVVEMMVVKLEEGWERLRAATFAYTATAFPMLTGTLVTAAGFVPVGFARSGAGEYAGGIFWVVSIALLVSWIVAVVFTPYIGYRLLPAPGSHLRAPGAALDHPIYRRVRRMVAWSLAHRWLVIALTVLAFVVALAGFRQVPRQFYPTSSRLELLVELRLNEGASFAATAGQVAALEARLQGDPAAESYTVYTGGGAPRFYLSLDQLLRNANVAQFVIRTPNADAREALRTRLMAYFERENLDSVRGRVLRLEFGPPVGFPVQFRVMGADPERVRAIAGEVREIMRANPLTRDVQFDWNERGRAVELVVDQDRARLLGLTPQDIATALSTLVDGTTVTQAREANDLIDIVVRAVPAERLDLDRLADLTIPTAAGRAVPLSQVARLVYGLEETTIWRRNRDVTLTVRSDIVDGVQPPVVTAQILPALQGTIERLPDGYRIEVGGAVEASARAQASLNKVMPAMVVLTLLILMVQLQSVSRLAMVVLTAPLGLIGVAAALLALHAPLGFVATLGVVALAGMIMRNSVILVDQIDREIAAGRDAWDAIVEATVRRARPISLTAAAAILAMIPLSRSVFWGPMAVAIMGGLVVATLLTLSFLPALYAAWFRVRRPGESRARLIATQPLAIDRGVRAEGPVAFADRDQNHAQADREGGDAADHQARHAPLSADHGAQERAAGRNLG